MSSALPLREPALRAFPELLSAFGEVGQSETATDRAPHSMVEAGVRLGRA